MSMNSYAMLAWERATDHENTLYRTGMGRRGWGTIESNRWNVVGKPHLTMVQSFRSHCNPSRGLMPPNSFVPAQLRRQGTGI